MRNNFYDVSRSVYGKEAFNMQPIAFGYVPAKKRNKTGKAIEDSASCVGVHCPTNHRLFTRQAVQNS